MSEMTRRELLLTLPALALALAPSRRRASRRFR